MKAREIKASADGSVSWIGPDGNRRHVWLVGTHSYEGGEWTWTPQRPLEVKSERRIGGSVERRTIYINPPRNADGTHLNRYDQGYFNTRYADADAKANKAEVDAILRYVEEHRLIELAQQTEREEAARKAVAEKTAYATKVRDALTTESETLMTECQYGASKAITEFLACADEDQLCRLGRMIQRV